MTATVFVDSNVFIYAFDDADQTKQASARTWRMELWKRRAGRVSFQVLNEFYVKVCQKWPAARLHARAEVRDLLRWHPVGVNAGLLEQAWKIQDRYRLSFWDAQIVAAARLASCHYLLTEDLQAGQNFDGVIVTNPFRDSPESLLDQS
jgi:predicted nucleic acid-binding protein